MPTRLVTLLALSLCAIVCARLKAQPLDTIGYEADARTEKTVNINEVCVTLSELLQKVSAPGLQLSADRTCVQQKVQVRLQERPVRLAMRSLADLIGGVWKPSPQGDGYQLRLSDRAGVYAQRWWGLVEGERERAKSVQRAFILSELNRVKDDAKRPNHDGPNDPVLAERLTKEHEFIRTLPESVKQRLADAADRSFMFTMGVNNFSGDEEEGAFLVPSVHLNDKQKALLQQHLSRFPKTAHIDLLQTYLMLQNGGFAVYASLMLPNGERIATDLMHSTGISPEALTINLDHSGLALRVKELGGRAPNAWKELAAYQERRVWKNDLSRASAKTFPRARRADVLQWLALHADIEYVADYYGSRGDFMNTADRKRPPERPVEELLNDLALSHDVSWKATPEKVYLVRNNRWYRDDAFEPPLALARAWLKTRPELSALFLPFDPKDASRPERFRQALDWSAEVVGQLTPMQLRGLMLFAEEHRFDAPLTKELDMRVGEQLPDGQTVMQNPFDKHPFYFVQWLLQCRNTLRLYASLDENGRGALVQGRLDADKLTPAQRELAAYVQPLLSALVNRPQTVLLGIQPKELGSGVRLVITNSPEFANSGDP